MVCVWDLAQNKITTSCRPLPPFCLYQLAKTKVSIIFVVLKFTRLIPDRPTQIFPKASDTKKMTLTKPKSSPPTITLRPVDRDNWREVAKLKVSEAQSEFVAEPLYYLSLCHYGEVWNPLAIYLDEQVIGFMMWAEDPDDGSCWLGGILIDSAYQRRGYGRQAVLTAVDKLSKKHGFHHFALSYQQANTTARQLYTRFGFVETGEQEGDEIVARLRLV